MMKTKKKEEVGVAEREMETETQNGLGESLWLVVKVLVSYFDR